MTRWACLTDYVTADQDRLQRVVIYSPGDNKEHHKREHEEFAYTRLLLLSEKGSKNPNYIISKIGRAGKGN